MGLSFYGSGLAWSRGFQIRTSGFREGWMGAIGSDTCGRRRKTDQLRRARLVALWPKSAICKGVGRSGRGTAWRTAYRGGRNHWCPPRLILNVRQNRPV